MALCCSLAKRNKTNRVQHFLEPPPPAICQRCSHAFVMLVEYARDKNCSNNSPKTGRYIKQQAVHKLFREEHPSPQVSNQIQTKSLISAFFFFFLRGSFSHNTPVHIKEGCSFTVQCSGSWFLHMQYSAIVIFGVKSNADHPHHFCRLRLFSKYVEKPLLSASYQNVAVCKLFVFRTGQN